MSQVSYNTTLLVDTTPNPHGLAVGQAVIIAGNGVAAYNATWQVSEVVSATQYKVSYYQLAAGAPTGNNGTSTGQGPTLARNNNLVTAHSTAAHGFQVGWYVVIAIGAPWDGTFQIAAIPSPTSFTYAQNGANAVATGAGTATPQGQISVGTHQVVEMFLTRQGYLTRPSPPATLNASGGKFALLSSLAIGPANVVARIFGFTGANGGNFFTILAQTTLPGGVIVNPTVVADNTSPSAILDFSDNALLGASGIDIEGNDLFDQAVLGPVAGFFSYGARLFAWGETNKVQKFQGMGFEGGYVASAPTVPLGWTIAAAGGALVAGQAGFGQAWRITGDGSGNTRGTIFQGAYQNWAGSPITQPLTAYSCRLWAQVSALNLAGTLFVQLSSASLNAAWEARFALNSLSTAGAFTAVTPLSGSTPLPATVPTDLILVSWASGHANASWVTIDEIEIIFSEKPYRDNLMRGSYVNNPEAFAQTTCDLGPDNDPSPLRSLSMLRNNVLLKTYSGIHEFQDNGTGEPGTWKVSEITRAVGCIAARGGDRGQFGNGDAAENWDVTLGYDGLYFYSGGEVLKVSQEYQTYFDQINRQYQHLAWVKNDQNKKRVLVGIPFGNATTPSKIFVLDYRELMTAAQIANSPPIHISLSGKMIASDLQRKWTRWNIPALCCELIRRPNSTDQLQIGLTGFGNAYSFDPAKLTDDDLGQKFPYYVTYFFINHEMEMALGLGTFRKLYKKLVSDVSGTGLVSWLPLMNSMNNPLPATSTRQLVSDASVFTPVKEDLEWTIGIRGPRCAFQLQIGPITDKKNPLYTNGTDVDFTLQKLIVTMAKDPIAAYRSMSL